MRERRMRRHALKHESEPRESDEATKVVSAMGILVVLVLLVGLLLEMTGAKW